MGVSSSFPVVNPGAKNYYDQALGTSMSNYNSIIAGYGQAQNNLQNSLGDIAAHYTGVRNAAIGDLGLTGGGWGVAAPAAQDIQRTFAQNQGRTMQNLIGSGLGNSSVLANLSAQNSEMAGRAYGNLGAQLADKAAGYETQIGLAGLGARMQGAGMQANLASSYLGNLAGYHFPTPPPMYGQQSTSTGAGGGGYGGATHGSASPGGASSAVNAAGAIPFGQAGGYDRMGYSGMSSMGNYFENPYGAVSQTFATDPYLNGTDWYAQAGTGYSPSAAADGGDIGGGGSFGDDYFFGGN